LEDGPIENATAFGFLLVGLPFLTYTFKLFKRSPNDLPYRRGLMVVSTVIALACIFVSLEEISWGQRVLGVQTPEALATINTQKELNVHNLFTNSFNEAYFIIGCVFMVINLVGMYLRVSLADKFLARFMPHPMHLILVGLVSSFSFHLEANELVEPLAVLYLGLYTVQVGLVLRDEQLVTVTSSDV
jgi:F0F1-type ATP synthase membrane subunit c/vacuolar-type H+-ATPase subunit K